MTAQEPQDAGTTDAIKAKLKRLLVQKQEMELELESCTGRLRLAGVDMHTPLVDAEGFPRADVDIPGIRAARQRIRVLSNDLRDLEKEQEQDLHRLHAAARRAPTVDAERPADLINSTPVDAARPADGPNPPPVPASARPFARVTAVSPASPAARGGMLTGDEVLEFGSRREGPLEDMAAALPGMTGSDVQVWVARHGAAVPLTIRPGPWAGRGLLGATLQPC